MGYRATRVAMRACQFSWHIAVDLLGDTQAGLFNLSFALFCTRTGSRTAYYPGAKKENQ